ncbi:diguanylate cyclase (GGDEF)-like protein [Povalibacter uvarum]|uniref:cyclic-guanylate-specific phosphodiesterase n=1 Tax=Povalibacter uvarum TaxID=732238 RepID=A0A841HL04_9GAMM|nr:diguanylate cyclase (GGDEF)-like protein [Povalibacter uvarum]
MQGTYTPWLVTLSIAVAVVVSYTALSLAARVANSRGRIATAWVIGGAAVMGVGIWSMHFIGMLALSLPIRLTYSLPITAVSLGIAIAASAFALNFASRSTLDIKGLSLSALLLGAGIAAMHYTGMAGVRIVPGIQYEPGLFLASIGIAVSASFVALWLFFRLRRGQSWQMMLARVGAAVVMGFAITGMHYTGMAASKFGLGSYCLPGASLDNKWFAIALAVFAFGVMAIAILTAVYDAWLHQQQRDSDAAMDHQRLRSSLSDALTGLPNRVALVSAAEDAMVRADRNGTQIALLVLDVDRLKAINDSLGHQAGDEMLLELSRRLRSVLRHNDILARLAGDEFTIVATDMRSAHAVETVVEKVLAALEQKFVVSGVEVHPSVSIGISTYPLDGNSFELLLRRANAAMRYTKDSARGGYRFYAAEMSSFIDDRLALESELRRAIETGELEIHYQPKVDIPTNRVRSCEALIRWRHPTRGMVSPMTFIPVAEETGLIVPLGEWVLRQACLQVRHWIDTGMSPVRVAVNLSAKQFRQANLPAIVQSALAEAHLEPGFIELELTESAVMHDPEASAQTLATLSAMGVHISIDDFGTGYSSLSYLRRFPLDKLKIDRSFIRDLMKNPDDVSIVKAIISLAHSLRLRVVAEGVETADQLEFLRQLGCDQYQGYYCSPAVTPDDFAALIQRLRAERPELTEADMLRTQSRLSAFTPEVAN